MQASGNTLLGGEGQRIYLVGRFLYTAGLLPALLTTDMRALMHKTSRENYL